MRRKQPFNKIEKLLLSIPTWIFVSAVVGLIVCLSLFVHEDNNHKSKCNTSGLLFEYNKLVCDGASILLQSAESFAVVAAVSLYFKEIPDRKARKHYEAWQVIDNAANVPTSYARKQALEDLCKDGVPLVGINISGSDLIRANLKNAILGSANLSGSDLRWADLSGSILQGADLSSANLIGANLIGADLSAADLSNANLTRVEFRGVNLFATTLSEADILGANLSGVIEFLPDPIQQIKSAKNWRSADYNPEIKKILGLVM
ncbi:pentapeptide repeat-containing protein [Altericista sp. CCNU0014]|uniref:pentapeptide repeat-containing protein n=1 Tax=Altericista sp. CCNU0014 TaxID=3082949 RepID=UPI00384AF65B